MATWGKGTFGPWSPPAPEGQDGQPGQDGEGQPGQGQPGQGQPGQGKGQGEPGQPGQPGQGQGQPGQGKGQPGQGQGSGQGTPDPNAPENQAAGSGQSIDDIYKDLEQKFGSKGDNSGKGPATPQDLAKGGGGSTTPGGANAPKERVTKPAVPTYSWKELMSQFIMTQKKPESTYAKVSKRSITGITTAVATGAGVVKPGERPDEEAFKLLFVFDTSGSMGGVVNKALAEASALVAQNFDNVHAAMGVTFFANSPEHFAANLGDKKYWPVASFNDLEKPSKLQRPIGELFQMRSSGGTNFTTAMAAELGSMASKGYNIIMFTDSDILYGTNWKVFLNFYKAHKRNMFLILDNRNTFDQVAKALGSVPNTFGSMDI